MTNTTVGPNENGRISTLIQNGATNVLFDHDTFVDINGQGVGDASTWSQYHGEVFYLRNVSNGLTVSNSVFSNFAEYAFFVSNSGVTGPLLATNVTITGNTFGACNAAHGGNAHAIRICIRERSRRASRTG